MHCTKKQLLIVSYCWTNSSMRAFISFFLFFSFFCSLQVFWYIAMDHMFHQGAAGHGVSFWVTVFCMFAANKQKNVHFLTQLADCCFAALPPSVLWSYCMMQTGKKKVWFWKFEFLSLKCSLRQTQMLLLGFIPHYSFCWLCLQSIGCSVSVCFFCLRLHQQRVWIFFFFCRYYYVCWSLKKKENVLRRQSLQVWGWFWPLQNALLITSAASGSVWVWRMSLLWKNTDSRSSLCWDPIKLSYLSSSLSVCTASARLTVI